jgi:trigger factor
VCSELTQAAEAGVANDMENQVLNRLIEDNDFKVPTSLVKRQLDYMVESAKARLEEKGFARNELDKKDDEFAGRFRDDAVRHVRLLFILDDIAAKENISAGPDDIDGAYMAISRKTGQPVEKVKEYYRKEDLEDGLKDRIKEEKVIKFLLDNAEISEAETER